MECLVEAAVKVKHLSPCEVEQVRHAHPLINHKGRKMIINGDK